MSLALSLQLYLRTSGSGPGVLPRVSLSLQLNRLSECPGPPQRLSSLPGSVPWSLLISLLFPCGLVSTVTGSTWLRLRLHNQPAQHRVQLPILTGGRVLLVTEPSGEQHKCSKSPGGQTIYKKDTPAPLVRCLVPARPVGIPPGSVCLGLPIHSLAALQSWEKLTQGWATSISTSSDGLSNRVLDTHMPPCVWLPL